MFDNSFVEYMWYLFVTPYKQVQKSKNQWFVWCKVIGAWFDECRDDLFTAQSQTMIATCDDAMLKEQGADRGLTQYRDESNYNFRRRIANYAEVKRLGGTDAGVLHAVRSLGIDNIEIQSAKKYCSDPERWAEFYVILHATMDDITLIDYDILKRTVREVKQVSAKDNYMLSLDGGEVSNYCYTKSCYVLIANCDNDNTQQCGVVYQFTVANKHSVTTTYIQHSNTWYFDGTYKFDGSRRFNAYYDEKSYTQHSNAWYFDGTYKFDGLRRFNADNKEES